MMKMRAILLMLGLAALFLTIWTGCGDEDPVSPGDTTSPAAVADLRVQSVTGSTVTLAWTAPGDDGDTGTASQYDIRYSGAPVTEGNWETGTLATTEPDPAVAGSVQHAIIDTGGKANFYFALKTADEASNWSGLSNVIMASVEDPALVVRQLTSEGQNIHPCLDDGHVVWVRVNTVEDNEIYLANLDVAQPAPTSLTDNGGEKGHPNNHGSERIVWEGRSDPAGDWEIWIYDKYTIPRFRALTDNEVHDRYPDLNTAGNFVWLQDTPMFEEVRYWNESAHSQSSLSDGCCPSDTWSNEIPSADAGEVVWRSYDQVGSEGFRVHLWDGTLTDLTDTLDGRMISNPSLDAGTIAFEYGANPTWIRYWNGSTVQEVAKGFNPSLSNGTIAFEEWDGHDLEIRYWDGSKVLEITDNDFNDTQVSLSGSQIVWVGRPGSSDLIYYVELEK